MNNNQYFKPALRLAVLLFLMLGSLHIHAYTKSNVSIWVNGTQRSMILFTPDNVTSGLPLMIVTHGMGQDPTYQYEGDHLYELIDTERFIVAYLASNGTTWDTGGNGDLDFVNAAIDHLDNQCHIDRNRLYWSGFSMGSMLIYHAIQTQMGKQFAAFAPCSGILFYNAPWNDRDIPINLIHCHAYGDEVFPYNSCEGKYDYSIRDYVTHFANDLNHNTNYVKTTGVQPNVADFWWVDGDKEVWSGGSNGGEVELFSANSGGHWPTGAYMYEIWNFCKRFSLDGSSTTPQGEANVTADYSVGDDIVSSAPTTWAGQTGEYSGLGHTAYERYNNSGSIGTGDVLTQTLTGVKNGTYSVTLELAASFTPDRGFTCPTGTGLSVAFANGEFSSLEVIERGWVSSVTPVTISCKVTDGTLRYGIYNIAAAGNWYVANVTSIQYVSTVAYDYNVGDDIVNLAPTDWEGETGKCAGLGGISERYKHGGDNGAGDMMTQTLTGLKNGVYAVTLELAASFTSGRGFDCPTGNGLSVAFANDTQTNLEVVDRDWVSSFTPITLYATVTDGILKYGIHNLQVSGNWYLANVTGIKYVSESTTLSYDLTVTEAGVATLYLPYDAAIPEADFFVATAVKSVSGTTAYLQEVHDVIPAQTGVMIFANPGQYTLSLSSTAADDVVSLLHGVLEDTPVSTLMALEGKSIYVLSRGIKEYTGFKRASTTVKTIPANRAYLPLDTPTEVNFINLSFSDPTAIINLSEWSESSEMSESSEKASWFTLDGRRLPAAPTRPGLYILNGKKILVK